MGVVARILGQMWSNLAPEEKRKYEEQAAMERDRYSKEMKQLEDAGMEISKLPGVAQPSENNPNGLTYPLSRVRKICKLDPEVRGLSKEVILLITKCAELATEKLGMETVRVAQIQNRRKLLPEDIAQVCSTREQFLFLCDDVKDLVREQVIHKKEETDKKKKEKEDTDLEGSDGEQKDKPLTKAEAAARNTKPLTAFFSTK